MQSAAFAEYAQLLHNLKHRYPSLVNLETLLPNSKEQYSRICRVRMVDIGSSPLQLRSLDDPDVLLAHLQQQDQDRSVHQRIYVLENLTLPHITLFGTFFNIDPCIFASQIRTADWEGGKDQNNTPKLLSSRDPASSFTLRYNELRYFANFPHGLLTELQAGRRITVTSKVASVRRCATFWCRENEESWDGMLHRTIICH